VFKVWQAIAAARRALRVAIIFSTECLPKSGERSSLHAGNSELFRTLCWTVYVDTHWSAAGVA